MHNACPRTTTIAYSIDLQHCKNMSNMHFYIMLRNVCMHIAQYMHIMHYKNAIIHIILHKPYNPSDVTQVSPTQNPNVVHYTRTTIIRLTLVVCTQL